MKEFYNKVCNKPKIFGMTASPVVSKGKKFVQVRYCERASILQGILNCLNHSCLYNIGVVGSEELPLDEDIFRIFF